MTSLKRMIACFIAVHNLPMSIVDGWAFQQLLLFFRPDLKLPGRNGIRNVIIKEYKAEKQRLAAFFASLNDSKVLMPMC